ncbi:unnamed protein product [Sphagnum balticum]
MAEAVARLLRDGVVVGEQAPAVMLCDSLQTRAAPALFTHFFASLTSNIAAGRAQAKSVVVVSLTFCVVVVADGWGRESLQLVDCYTDPLGWNERIQGAEKLGEDGGRHTELEASSAYSTLCHDISDLNSLLSIVLRSGQAAVNQQSKAHFAVLIDSISFLLRYQSVAAITNFLSALRSHEQVSALMWVVHGDLHEARVVASLEYVATTVIHIKPQIHLPGQMLETQHKRETRRHGRIYVRQKKRNGRVREQVEEFQIENSGVKFAPVTLMTEMHQAVSLTSSMPKVQFNLELSDKEREDRSKVVLPFEHQGDGKEVHIYDGRPDSVQSTFGSLNVVNGGSRHPEVVGSVAHKPSGVGEIHYLRDSDDERPDSDEDPDDDLDI